MNRLPDPPPTHHNPEPLTAEQIANLTPMQVSMLRPGLVLEVEPGVWKRVKDVFTGHTALFVMAVPHDGPPVPPGETPCDGGVQVNTEPGGEPPPKP